MNAGGRHRRELSLTGGPSAPIASGASRLDGRRSSRAEESPGSTETRRRITSGGGDPRESATESRPPASRPARVKGCGKSAPRGRQRQRHGKPRREQDRIGATRSAKSASGPSPGQSFGLVARGVRQRTSQRNGRHARGSRPEPYRTRLTGRLAFSDSRTPLPSQARTPAYALIEERRPHVRGAPPCRRAAPSAGAGTRIVRSTGKRAAAEAAQPGSAPARQYCSEPSLAPIG
jgi:hypothetical protein